MTREEREEMIQGYSDYHKEAYGFRPRFDYSALSDEELLADFDRFEKEVEIAFAHNAIMEQEGIKSFKTLVSKTIAHGAADEDEAIKWLISAEIDLSDYSIMDIEHFVWGQGFLFTEYGRDLVKRIEIILTKSVDVK